MPTTSELACSTATKTLARPSRMVIVCVMSVPHISLTLSVMIVPSCGLVSVCPTRCGASMPFSRITRRTRRALVRTPAKRNRAHNLRSLAVKAGGGYVLADMLCQFRVRACADRTRATGDTGFHRLPRYYEEIRLLNGRRPVVVAFFGSTVRAPPSLKRDGVPPARTHPDLPG